MVQKPGEHHAVWHFWTGPDRTFANWYINLQTAFVRTAVGYDTQDLELDIVVQPDGRWTLKDLDTERRLGLARTSTLLAGCNSVTLTSVRGRTLVGFRVEGLPIRLQSSIVDHR